MSSLDVSLCREILRLTIADVRAFNPAVRLKDAWVYKLGEDHWEFHYGDYYWHGSADNAYEARAEGWSAWLGSQGAPEYTRETAE